MISKYEADAEAGFFNTEWREDVADQVSKSTKPACLAVKLHVTSVDTS